jgi:hypothetical protein
VKDDTVASFQKAAQFRKLIASLKEAGWMPGPVVTPADTAAGPMVYVCDVESGTMYLIVLPKDAIERTIADGKIAGVRLTKDEVESHASAFFAHVASSKTVLTEEEHHYAGVILPLYLAQTTAYEMAKADINSAHFIVVRYRCAKTGTFWNRTVAVLASMQLGPAQIEMVANRVLDTDRKRCPERFPRATVLPFRLRPADADRPVR